MLQPPRPWHLILAPALPFLALLANNLAVTIPRVIAGPAAAVAAATVCLWLLLTPLAFDTRRAALAATQVALLATSYRMLSSIATLIGVPLGAPLVCAAGLIASARMLRSREPAVAATTTANRLSIAAVTLVAAPMLWGEATRPRLAVEPFAIAAAAGDARPDVYVIVLDAYAREDVLRDIYRVESRLAADLRRLGFAVGANAAANYAHTALSMASALNGDYLPALGQPSDPNLATRRGLADLMAHSRFFSAFAAAGYHIRAYASAYPMLRPAPAHERPAPIGYPDEFRLAALEATALPALAGAAGFNRVWPGGSLHRRHVRWTLDHLAAAPPDESPALVFAHVLAPHPPFVFDADGGPRRTRLRALLTDANYWHEMAAGTGERYEDGYADAVRALDPMVSRAVAAIAARRRPAVILVHGDHGPGSRLQWDDLAATDLRERLGILLALRFPDGETPPPGAGATLVNAYRAVLNRALGSALPPLEDRVFFSSWLAPFAYVDVTGRLDCDDRD